MVMHYQEPVIAVKVKVINADWYVKNVIFSYCIFKTTDLFAIKLSLMVHGICIILYWQQPYSHSRHTIGVGGTRRTYHLVIMVNMNINLTLAHSKTKWLTSSTKSQQILEKHLVISQSYYCIAASYCFLWSDHPLPHPTLKAVEACVPGLPETWREIMK